MHGFVSFPSSGVSKDQAEAGVTRALARFLRLSPESVRKVDAAVVERRMLGEAIQMWSPFRRLSAAWNVSFELSAPAPQAPSLEAELARMAAYPGESEAREFSTFLARAISDLGGAPTANILALFSYRGVTASSSIPSISSSTSPPTPTSPPQAAVDSENTEDDGGIDVLYVVLLTVAVTLLVACFLGLAWRLISSKYFSQDASSAHADLLASSGSAAAASGSMGKRPVAEGSQLFGRSTGAGEEPAVSPEVADEFPEYDPRLFGEDLADSSALPPLDPIDQHVLTRALPPAGQEPFYQPAARPLPLPDTAADPAARPLPPTDTAAALNGSSPVVQTPSTWRTPERPAATLAASDADNCAGSDVAWSAVQPVGRDEQLQSHSAALYFTIDSEIAQILSHCLWKGAWTWTSHTPVQVAAPPVLAALRRHYRLTFHPGSKLEGQGEDATGRWNIANGSYKPGGRMRWREVSAGALLHCEGQLRVRQPAQSEEVYEIVGSFTAFDTSLASRSIGRGKFLLAMADSEESIGRSTKSEPAESRSGPLGSGAASYQDDRV